jgi:hypothetical protein
MRKFNFRAWLGLAFVGATVAPLATQQAVAAPGDVNTEIRISVFKDGAGALDAAPDNAPLPSPSSVYGGTGATFVLPDAIADDQITGPISWDAGEDASYNNQIVRTFDQIVYKMEWNVNEQNNQQIDVATKNVVISSTLPNDAATAWADLTWLGGADLPPTCLTTGVTPVSSISTDGRTLTCNLGDQFQGSNGSVYPLARLAERQGLPADRLDQQRRQRCSGCIEQGLDRRLGPPPVGLGQVRRQLCPELRPASGLYPAWRVRHLGPT